MATFKCKSCGETKDGRCKPKECPKCGETGTMEKEGSSGCGCKCS
jgi:rubrerythrin